MTSQRFQRDAAGRLVTRALAALLFCALLLPAVAPAKKKKEKKNEAQVVGTVVNQQDDAIAGARITVTAKQDPDFRLEVKTDGQGEFEFTVDEPVGDYVFHVESAGYAPFDGTVTLTAGEQANLGFQLIDAAAGRQQDAVKAFNAGVQAFSEDDLAAAEAKFQESAELDPAMPEPHQGLAEVYFKQEKLDEAAAAIEKYLEDRPDDVSALSLAYTIYRETGNTERTDELVDALAKTDKAKPLARQVYNEGVAATQEGNNERAIDRFRRAASLDPELAPAYSSLATILYNEARYGEAGEVVEKLFTLDPDNVQGRRIRYLIFDALDDQPKASAALASYIEVDPDGAVDVMYQRADMDFRDGRTDKAIAALKRILELEPEMARAHYTLGLCYASSDKTKAREHLERFLELAPEDPEAETAKEMLTYF